MVTQCNRLFLCFIIVIAFVKDVLHYAKVRYDVYEW